MKRVILLIISCLVISCVSKKEFNSKEQQIVSLQKQLDSIQKFGLLDTDGDGVIDKYDMCPTDKAEILGNGCPDQDQDGVSDLEDACPNEEGLKSNRGCPDKSPTYVQSSVPEHIIYFQKLYPTRTVFLHSFFKTGTPLKEVNTQLVAVIEKKLKITFGDYKYFYIGNGNYAIVTRKECITKDGKTINLEKCTPDKSCSWYELSCVEEGYSRFYLFLITKDILGDNSAGFEEKEFKRLFETDALKPNWKSIPEINKLLSNTNNKFTEDYSIAVKFFEIKKEGQMGNPEILVDPTYEFKKQIESKFQSNTSH